MSKKFIYLSSILLFFAVFLPFAYSVDGIIKGPAFGSIAGGVKVSTEDFTNTVEFPSLKIGQLYSRQLAVNHKPVLVDDNYDKSKALAPLRNNEFYDPSASAVIQQQVHSPAIVIDFQGPSHSAISYFPPDPHIATGPNHVVVVDNSTFTIYDKKGNKLKEILAREWFSSLIPDSGPFDCQIIYDHFEERWVQEWLTRDDDNLTSHWLISVSDDSDPLGSWCNFAFPNHLNGTEDVGNWGDYPKIGYDQQAFYISGRQLNFENKLDYCKLRIIPKSQLYNTDALPVDYTDFWDFRVPSDSTVVVDGPPIPATHFDSNDTAYVVVDSPYETANFITLWTFASPLSPIPVVGATNIPVTAAQEPPDGKQLGGFPHIHSAGRTYRNAVYKTGNLWTVHAVAGGNFNKSTFARYLRLDVFSKSVLEDVAFGADGYFYLYPAVMLDEDNNLYIVFTRTSALKYAGAAFTGRRANDPPGLAPSVIFKEGEAFYEGVDASNRNRWGDYMGIALDPANPNTVWGFVEYAANPENTWGTWVGAFTQQYTVIGTVRDVVSNDPIEFAQINILETSQKIASDASGNFSFGSPNPEINMSVSAFAHLDNALALIINPYGPDTLEIELQREIESSIAGHISDENEKGIEAQLLFFARGNPYPGLQTIIGVYDIEVYPESPYLSKQVNDVSLTTSPLTLDIILQKADIMLVDDDGGKSHEKYYIQALAALKKTHYLWDTQKDGLPTEDIRSSYPDSLIIWFTGDSSLSPLNISEQDELRQHLNAGGKLFLTGQDIAQYSFDEGLSDTLGAKFQDNSIIDLVRGITSDEISHGLTLLIEGPGGANNQISPDILDITDSSTTATIFHYGSGTTNPAGIHYANAQSNSRAVFLGFGFEAITDSSSRSQLMQKILAYLLDTPVGFEPHILADLIPGTFALHQNYPNPFNPSTTIEFDLPTACQVSLKIYNILGEEVVTLVSDRLTAGSYNYQWDASGLASGIYIYHLSTEAYSATRKMILMK
jgi:hypothetical protein